MISDKELNCVGRIITSIRWVLRMFVFWDLKRKHYNVSARGKMLGFKTSKRLKRPLYCCGSECSYSQMKCLQPLQASAYNASTLNNVVFLLTSSWKTVKVCILSWNIWAIVQKAPLSLSLLHSSSTPPLYTGGHQSQILYTSPQRDPRLFLYLTLKCTELLPAIMFLVKNHVIFQNSSSPIAIWSMVGWQDIPVWPSQSWFGFVCSKSW